MDIVDADFERRWAAWISRGVAHDRSVRLKSLFGAGFAALAIAGAIAFIVLNM